jgi:glycosyltransferase A (GT-A) superfamily protein (DUF2064 family)
MKQVLLFAQQPLYGQVLPSLVPPLNPVYASLLYHAMLRDQLRACREIKDLRVCICFAKGLLPGFFEGDYSWELQVGENPEQCRLNAFSSAFKKGATRVLALEISPAVLGTGPLNQAFEALENNSVVLGSGMLGLTRFLPQLIVAKDHLFQDLAEALALKTRTIDGGLSFLDYGYLLQQLENDPNLAPLCAYTLNTLRP